MSIHRKLTTVCCAAVLALGLAACGSDDDKMDMAPPMDTNGDGMEPTALEIATELADRLESVDVAELLSNAVKYSKMLLSQDVNGDSAMATANAEMVLTAETAINDAVTAADTAIMEANAAKMAAEDIENEAEKNAVMRLLDDAIETAMEVKKAAKAIDEDLSAAVAVVEGDDKEMPNTAADAGEAVSIAVRAAIAAVTEGTIGTPPAMGIVQMNDASDIGAMTWAMIVGEDNVMDVRRLDNDATPAAVVPVKAMSVMGSMSADLAAPDADNLPADNDSSDDGFSFDAVYNGIGGSVFCAGADCKTDSDGNLTGSWYFTPTNAGELYIADSDEGSYTPALMYARYGYWLTFGEDGAVNTFASIGNTSATNPTNIDNLDLGGEGDPVADVTASYTGKAAGISVRDKTSGHFTANVDLVATFGESPMLGGAISEFDGNAANPEWNVLLANTGITELGAADMGGGLTYGGVLPAAGNWTAQGYGPAQTPSDAGNPVVDHRPEGFFGQFNANFSDGAAAGAYATRTAE